MFIYKNTQAVIDAVVNECQKNIEHDNKRIDQSKPNSREANSARGSRAAYGWILNLVTDYKLHEETVEEAA